MNRLSRRDFLAAGAATFATAAHIPRSSHAQATAPISLSAATRTLDIDGRAAKGFWPCLIAVRGSSLIRGRDFVLI